MLSDNRPCFVQRRGCHSVYVPDRIAYDVVYHSENLHRVKGREVES